MIREIPYLMCLGHSRGPGIRFASVYTTHTLKGQPDQTIRGNTMPGERRLTAAVTSVAPYGFETNQD